jgi:hypothetical protein
MLNFIKIILDKEFNCVSNIVFLYLKAVTVKIRYNSEMI